MRNAKKDKLEAVKTLFRKKKVLKIEDIFKQLETASRMTVHRYIKELDYLISYSHKGRYYTLKEIAQFDKNGLWHYGDIGFSKQGTLFDTIAYFVNCSEEGMTSSELQIESRTVVKYALLDLVEKNKLSRVKPSQVYVYLSPDPTKAEKQLKKRQKMIFDAIDDTIALRILLIAYKLVEGHVSPEQVAIALKKEGADISLRVVQQVFQHYGLEKKTSDFTSSQL